MVVLSSHFLLYFCIQSSLILFKLYIINYDILIVPIILTYFIFISILQN